MYKGNVNTPFQADEEAHKQTLIAGLFSSLKKYSMISHPSWYFEKIASTASTTVKNIMSALDYDLQNVVSFLDHLNHNMHRLSVGCWI